MRRHFKELGNPERRIESIEERKIREISDLQNEIDDLYDQMRYFDNLVTKAYTKGDQYCIRKYQMESDIRWSWIKVKKEQLHKLDPKYPLPISLPDIPEFAELD